MTKPAKMSAYQKMFSMQRPRVLEEHPDATQPQLLQMMAAIWNTFDAESKQAFEEIAEQDHATALEEWKAECAQRAPERKHVCKELGLPEATSWEALEEYAKKAKQDRKDAKKAR